MTDGILLAEMQRDRLLRRYDTLIIDEAHERSLNIDFILGYLEQLLPRRPDLKVIITSATIDPERFARHFAGRRRAGRRGRPGRTYPVEVRYRPLVEVAEGEEDGDGDEENAATRSRRSRRGRRAGRRGPRRHPGVPHRRAGDPGHRRRAGQLARSARADTEILPLYARLSAAEQHRVFQRTPAAGSCWPPTSPRPR